MVLQEIPMIQNVMNIISNAQVYSNALTYAINVMVVSIAVMGQMKVPAQPYVSGLNLKNAASQ